MVVLCYHKDQLRNYLLTLSKLMTIIKTKTGQIFIPTAIQNNPMSTDQEMMIIMRSIEKLDKFAIDREGIIDDVKLSKCFTTRNFQFISAGANERAQQLHNDLRNFYKTDGLMVIGGIQDPGKVNNLQLLFYKTESHRVGSKADTATYDIKVEAMLDITNEKDFEILLNKAQVDSNSQLRSIITFEDTYSKHHFIILQEYNADRLYMITEYPESAHEEYQAILKQQMISKRGDLDYQQRQILSEKLSAYMNVQEKRNANTVVECITNSNFTDSYIVYSQ